MSVNERGCGSNPHLGTKRKHRCSLGCRAVSWAVLSYTAGETRRPLSLSMRASKMRGFPLRRASVRQDWPKDFGECSLFASRLGAASNRMSVSILCSRTYKNRSEPVIRDTADRRCRTSRSPERYFVGTLPRAVGVNADELFARAGYRTAPGDRLGPTKSVQVGPRQIVVGSCLRGHFDIRHKLR